MNMKKIISTFIVLASLSCVTSCSKDSDNPTPATSNELEDLPEDTGGTHTPKIKGSTSALFGYYEYLPAGYNSNSNEYPLLVFLHGKGERGNGESTQAQLDKVLANGPPKLIKNKTWDPKYPMIVISPQYHPIAGDVNDNNWAGGFPERLKTFIEYLKDTYRVNDSRIYLTGLSYGGNGVYDYLILVDGTTSHIAAAAPIAAYGPKNPAGYAKSKNIPVWAFVSSNDGINTPTTKDFITKYNSQTPAPKFNAKLSVFTVAVSTHDVWTRVYSGSGIGTADANFDPFDKPLYDWFFEHKRE